MQWAVQRKIVRAVHVAASTIIVHDARSAVDGRRFVTVLPWRKSLSTVPMTCKVLATPTAKESQVTKS